MSVTCWLVDCTVAQGCIRPCFWSLPICRCVGVSCVSIALCFLHFGMPSAWPIFHDLLMPVRLEQAGCYPEVTPNRLVAADFCSGCWYSSRTTLCMFSCSGLWVVWGLSMQLSLCVAAVECTGIITLVLGNQLQYQGVTSSDVMMVVLSGEDPS